MAKEDGLIRDNAIKLSSSSSSEDGEEDSKIRSNFCLKKNVCMEKLDQEEEDCRILDSNPFKSDYLSEKFSFFKKDDDDHAQELSVTGQRGQVACRDYPHSRHLCSQFPFNKTPHEDYCKQCYCYVCDSIAPCLLWRRPEGGHCDATEHDELWKLLRECYKLAPTAECADP